VRTTRSVAHASRPEARQDPVGPHRAHLAGRAGQEDRHPAVRAVHPPSRGGPVRVGDGRRGRDPPCLLQVDLGKANASLREKAAKPPLQHRIDDWHLADRCGHRLAGQVVRGRADAAGRDDEVDRRERLPKRGGDRREIVGQGDDAANVDAEPGQRPGQLAAVRVARLAVRDLAADRQQRGRAERSPVPRAGTIDRVQR
jgi:hypothetical protein